MVWSEVFLVLVVCHCAGDFLLQTEFQATRKPGGLGRDPVARRALLTHIATYALPMVAALVWVGTETDALHVALVGVLVLGTHLVQDDGRLLVRWVARVKKTSTPFGSPLWMAIDQSFHLVWLFAAALAAAA
ncbi:DUF3307 domain-containing protein [Conexibacter sp. W3-3-2]|uniref:DUF3307 domain-containing protein n=1 Tax=Paraconexibacter algicola TaxID=2133960 RepID=A0A2T4UDU2_9ACTN|nr:MULTISPECIES: DUF3307 domain-containing protein [Solirubrobacterales]MTD43942.1 DUF3307 domain-containing protein [Conexibacter sp. W3-3-2]PTL55674.1 hypothetical protein C7Y72_18755 [Paraconexibacter algicola]